MDADTLSGIVGTRLTPGWAARVDGWRVMFNKGGEGERGDQVTADLVQRHGCTTYGVVYRLPKRFLPALDEFEGAPVHYRRATLWVEPLGRRARQAVTAYLAQPGWRVAASEPAADYLRSLLGGATAHGLPPAYVAWLERLARGEVSDCFAESRDAG